MRFAKISCFALLPLVLLGCDKQQDGADDGGFGIVSLFDPVAINPSLCGSPAIPFPNNALFSGFTDPTLNIPNAANTSFVTAANLTDGFSTTASILTDVLGTVDYSTADEAVVIVEFTPPSTRRVLDYGVDYTIQPSIAMAQLSGTGHTTGTCTGLVPARFMPISQQRSRLLIEPLKPLKESTMYVVAVTKALKSADGIAIAASEQFPVTNSDTKVCKLGSTGSDATGSEPLCTDPAAKTRAASIAPVMAQFSVAQLTTIETLRRSLIRPAVTGVLKPAYAAEFGKTLNDSDIAIAWSFHTQSIGNTLRDINTNNPFSAPRTLGVTTAGTNTQAATGYPYANLYYGTVSLPYFLHDPTAGLISGLPAILATFFGADPDAPDLSASFLGQAACAAFEQPGGVPGFTPSVSTTICYPRPVLRSDKVVPLLVAVPNSTAPGNCGGRGTIAGSHASTLTCVAPNGGWPVVIFQHGITRNRTDMIAIAPQLAAAGFVVVAIDMPLHGLVDSAAAVTPGCGASATNSFYAGSAERTFGVDYVNNATGASGPDSPTKMDCSGTHFVNLASLITSRDNLRQAELDIVHLAKSVNGLDFDSNSGTDEIAETNLRFVGQSLGAIVGTTVMGVDVGADATVDGNDEVFSRASLNVPGGALGKLLDASASFGPRIAAGLGALFVYEGTDTYETFVRFAQHLTDPADPINYAAAAGLNHPIHMTEVIGDAVVPNSAGTTCPAPSTLPFGLGATGTTVDAAGTAAASGQAAAALLAYCPPLRLPADAPLRAITYQDEVVVTGFLSGTQPLARVMGITTSFNMGNPTGSPLPTFTGQTAAAADTDTLVVFAPDTAEHGTLLSPFASSYDPDGDGVSNTDTTTYPPTSAVGQFFPATCAEQKQTATFLVTGSIPIGGACP